MMVKAVKFRHLKGVKAMVERFGEKMTPEETAKYLKTGKYTLYKIEKEGNIPQVKVEPEKNNKVSIRFSYNQELIKKIKNISGIRWNPADRCWEIPYNDVIISKLLNLFGEKLVIDPYFYLLPLQKELSIRKYSPKTVKIYMRYNLPFPSIY